MVGIDQGEQKWRAVRFSLALLVAVIACLLTSASALATFPGQNGKIAFIHYRALWTINPDGTGLRKIATESEFSNRKVKIGLEGPAWSLDGDQLFVTGPSYTGCFESLYKMAANGSRLTKITGPVRNHYYNCNPDLWAAYQPRPGRLVFQHLGVSTGLFFTSLDGRTSGRFHIPGRYSSPAAPDFSADGTTMVFEASTGKHLQIFVAGLSPRGTVVANSIRAITPPSRASYEPSLSPNGQSVVFQGTAGGRDAIFSVPIDGIGLHRLSAIEPGDASMLPCFSPDERYIAYYRTSPHNEQQIWLMNADGSDPHQLTHLHYPAGAAPLLGRGPAWQSR